MSAHNTQLYTTIEAWDPDEWPHDYEHGTMEALNATLPRNYRFVLDSVDDHSYPVVELQKYLGEYDRTTDEVMLE